MLGRLLRIVRWEFWPIWAMYLPLAPYLLWLAIRHRSTRVFMASNPGMFSGGLVGESKPGILAELAKRAPEFTPAFRVVRRGGQIEAEMFPVVAKPDRGERGQGVRVIRSQADLDAYLAAAPCDTILQEYVSGLEFGIGCMRRPGAESFEITSLTHKTFPIVVGDGIHTLEDLVLRDPRAVCLAQRYAMELGPRAKEVPAPGVEVQLVEIGSHSRGSIFLDASRLGTPQLTAAIARVAKAHPGFHIGRFDLRSPSIEALQRGEFRVLELNGVAAEPVHIYDPAVSMVSAYRALAAHWRWAFAIGAANRKAGTIPAHWVDVLRAIH
ncbi:MAG: hypothetical protein U0Q16_19945 [Bryobacteraceae bacterium]